MLLTLYDSTGKIKASIAPDDNSTQDKSIQGDNLLKLSFTLHEFVGVDVNDYIDYGGERYRAVERYVPSQKSTVEWEYSLQLYGIESLITRFLVLNDTDRDSEAVFALTARPIDHVRLIVRNINAGMDGMTHFKAGTVEGTDNVVIDYRGKYCHEALKELAEAVGTEWWFDGETLNLCRCEHGEEVALGYDKGLTSLDRDTADGAKFYTRLFPIGSSRNIDPAKYGHSRLMLPDGAKYVDVNVEKYGIIHHYEQNAFAHIYPRRVGVVGSVRHEVRKNTDGKPFTIYYFRDNNLSFDPNDYEIGGLKKRVSFQEGSELAGLGTDNDHYFETDYNSDTKEFEIFTIWPYDDDTQLPGGTLVPKAGDRYVLWNIRMPDEYYGLAEKEFRAAVDEYNRKHALDVSRYKAPTDHVWMEDTGTELFVGRRVRLESREYFPGSGYRRSRITRISRKVCLPGQMDIEISDALSTGTLEKIDDAIAGVKNYTGAMLGAINVPDVIRSWEDTKPTDTNLYSARKMHKEFLDANNPDRARKKITFDEGIDIGDFIPGAHGGRVDGEGNAELLSLMVANRYGISREGAARITSLLVGDVHGISADGIGKLASLLVGGKHGISKEGAGRLKSLALNDRYGITETGEATLDGVRSADFRPGTAKGFDGEGFGITRDALGKYTLELDNIIARGRMILAELEVHRMSYIGGEVVLSPCGNRINAVEARNEAGAVIDVNASDDGFLFALNGQIIAVNGGTLSTRTGGPATYYRCYFLATDGEESVKNEWSVGQLARSRTNNISSPGSYTDYENRDYWRIVVGVSRQPVDVGGKKYHYIDLSNAAPDTDVSLTDGDGVTHVFPYGGHGVGYDSTPQAGDSVVGMGHAWDRNRWNVAILSAINIGWVCYNGIDRFDLAEERIVNEFSTRRVRVASDRFELVPYADPGNLSSVLIDRGLYGGSVRYGRNDLVSYKGELWKCCVGPGETVIGQEPGVGNLYWERYVMRGADGVDGKDGAPGAPGADGRDGQKGEDGKAYGVRYYTNSVPISTLPHELINGALFEAHSLLNGQPYQAGRIVLGLYDSAGRQLGDLVDVQTPSDGIPDFGSLFVPSDCAVIRCTFFDADGVTALCEDSISIVHNGVDGAPGEKGEKGKKGDDGAAAVSYSIVRKGETAVALAVSGTGDGAAFRLSGKFSYGVTKAVGNSAPMAVTAPLTGKYTLEGAERLLTYTAATCLLTGTYTGTQAYTAANAGDMPSSVLVTVTFVEDGKTITLTDSVPVTVGGGVVIAIDNGMGSIRQDVADAQGNISTLRQTAEGLSSKVASIAGGGNLLWDAGFAHIVGENTPATRTGVRAFMGRTSSAWVGGTLDGQNCFNVHNKGLAYNAYSGITWRVPFSMAGRFTAAVQSMVTGVSGGEETQGNIEFVAHAADGTRLKTFFAASAVNRSTAEQGAFRQLWVTGDVAGTYTVGGTVYKVAYIAVNVWLLCNGTIRFAKPQFERGASPTEWGLSPMDSVHSEIEQSREAVRLGVSDDMRRTGIDITRGLIRIAGGKTRVEGNLDVSDGPVTLRDAEGIDRVRMTSQPIGALDAQTVVATRRFAVVKEVVAGAQLRFDMLDGALLALEKDAQFWGCGSIEEIYENTGDYNDYSIEMTTYEKQADGLLLPTANNAPWNAIIPQGYSYRVSLVNDSGVSSQISTTDFANGNTPNSAVAYIDPGNVIKAAQAGNYRLYLDVMNGAEIGASGSAKTYVVRAELILKAVTASKTIIGNDGIYTAHGKNHYLYYGQDGFLAGVERSDLTEGISSTGALRPKKDVYPEACHYAKNDRLWTKNRATGAAHIAEFAVWENGQIAYHPHWTNSQGAANYQQTDGAERDTGNVCIVAASTDVVIYDSAVAVRGSQDSSSPVLDISRAEYDGHVLELYLIDTANQGTDGYNTVYIGRGSLMVDLLGKMNAQGNAGHVLPGSTQNTLGLKAVQIERRVRKMRMLFVKEYRTVSEVYNNVWLITGIE